MSFSACANKQNISLFDQNNGLHQQIALAGIEVAKEAKAIKKTTRTKTKKAIRER